MTDPRRKRLLIDRRFQLALIGKLLAVQLVLLALATAALWLFTDSELGATLQRASITAASVRELIAPVLITMGVVSAALATVATFLVVLVASHRIAGPLVRYKRNLRLIAQGKLPPPLRTRPDDYLKEEVVCLNEAVAGVRQRIDAIREAQVAVAREIQAVVARSPRQASALLEPLVVAGHQLERTIGAFEHHDTRDDRVATETEPGQTMFAFAVPGGGS